MKATKDFIRGIPKILLHDHLDGGVRVQTIIELAAQQGYTELPINDPDSLGKWFLQGANRGSLPEYLEGFRHTCAVMQTAEALERIAYETLEDMKLDNVYYIETRFAPLNHLEGGLTPDEVVTAVLAGLDRGKNDFGVHYGLILSAMRHMSPASSLQVAQLAVKFRHKGVVGFDIAGAENGFSPHHHIEAFNYIRKHHFNITIHAGEGYGLESIRQAVEECGAHRIGHGTHLVDDMVIDAEGSILSMGSLSQFILNQRLPLEMCITSNLHTGAIHKIENHPFKLFFKHKFRVTLNTDNRLMSGITMTDEFFLAHTLFDMSCDDLFRITLCSIKSAFMNYADRVKLIATVLEPKYFEHMSQAENSDLDTYLDQMDSNQTGRSRFDSTASLADVDPYLRPRVGSVSSLDLGFDASKFQSSAEDDSEKVY